MAVGAENGCWHPPNPPNRALEQEEQQLLVTLPPQPNRLAQVQAWLAERRHALNAEHHVIDAQQLVGVCSRLR